MENKDNNTWKDNLSTIISKVWIPEAVREAHSALHRKNFYHPGFAPAAKVTCWEQYEKLVKDQFSSSQWIFRGHSDAGWRLEKSLERAVLRHIDEGPERPPRESYIVRHPNDFERILLDKAKQLACSYQGELPADGEILEWLSLLQHHGAPTRLLDWTRSPYVAAYFAFTGASGPAVDSAVWVIDSEWLKQKALEHHNVNISSADSVNGILRSRENVRLVMAPPVGSNPRMVAQHGLFLCDLSDEETFDITLLKMIVPSVVPPTLPDAPVVWKIVISTEERATFDHQLDMMKINQSSLFPGQDFAAPLKEEVRHTVNELIDGLGWRRC